jgi:hypothetical protein
MPTGQPECQECFTVARVTLLILAENGLGPVGEAFDGEGEEAAGVDGAAEAAGGGDAAAPVPPPPQADESVTQSTAVRIPRVARLIFEGLHG